MTTKPVCKVCWRPLHEDADNNTCCSKACASAPRTDWDALRGKYHAEEIERRYPTEVARAPYINHCPLNCTDSNHDHPRADPRQPGNRAKLRDVVRNEQTTDSLAAMRERAKLPHNAWFITRFNLIQYLKDKVDQNDWPAVSDAANDLRVLEATEPK